MQDGEASTHPMMGFLVTPAHHPNRVIATGSPTRAPPADSQWQLQRPDDTLGF